MGQDLQVHVAADQRPVRWSALRAVIQWVGIERRGSVWFPVFSAGTECTFPRFGGKTGKQKCKSLTPTPPSGEWNLSAIHLKYKGDQVFRCLVNRNPRGQGTMAKRDICYREAEWDVASWGGAVEEGGRLQSSTSFRCSFAPNDKVLNTQGSRAVWFPHHERPPNALWLEEPRGIDRRNVFGTELEEKEKSQTKMLHDCKPNRNTHKLLKCRQNQTKPK